MASLRQQDLAYRESVLPSAIRARVSIEAGTTIGWHKYVGDDGIAYGSTTSARRRRRRRIAEAFGFTPAHIADVATGLLAGV